MSLRVAARSAPPPSPHPPSVEAPYIRAGTALALSVDDGRHVACGWLDPLEPFLADHRPAGKPLLGTVGGLEVLAAWMRFGGVEQEVVAIEAVEAIRPIVFEGDTPRRVVARWRPNGATIGGGKIDAELSTDDGDGLGGETVHVRCVFVYDETAPPTLRRETYESGVLHAGAVGADEIYRVFFHGPTFQVVARAQLRGAVMTSCLAKPLPPWSATRRSCRVAPRLIEFGLQTAGLLQLALDGAMMIPRHIDRLERHRATDVDVGSSMFAIAERAGQNPDDPIDVRVYDAEGAVHASIAGYRCVALPFATDDFGLKSLAERLRSTRVDHQP